MTFHDDETLALIQEGWWKSLDGLTDSKALEGKLTAFDQKYLDQIENFLSIEAKPENALNDLLGYTSTTSSFRLPFGGFLVSYMLKSAMYNFGKMDFKMNNISIKITFSRIKRFLRNFSKYVNSLDSHSFGMFLMLFSEPSIVSLAGIFWLAQR